MHGYTALFSPVDEASPTEPQDNSCPGRAKEVLPPAPEQDDSTSSRQQGGLCFWDIKAILRSATGWHSPPVSQPPDNHHPQALFVPSMASAPFPTQFEMEVDVATDFHGCPGSSTAPSSTGAPPVDKSCFELAASSVRLRSFLPVKIIQRHAGGIKPFEVAFPCEVLLRPISGPYGNFLGCEEGERYVFSMSPCRSCLCLSFNWIRCLHRLQRSAVGTASLYTAKKSLLVTTSQVGKLETLIADLVAAMQEARILVGR